MLKVFHAHKVINEGCKQPRKGEWYLTVYEETADKKNREGIEIVTAVRNRKTTLMPFPRNKQ
jgi:hypothetical protein